MAAVLVVPLGVSNARSERQDLTAKVERRPNMKSARLKRLLAAVALGAAPNPVGNEVKAMAAWGIALSLVLANGLRLAQVEGFVSRHLAQVPPLARAAAHPELVFVNIYRGFYTQDLVQNDPFLRAARVVLVSRGAEDDAALAARRFPGYRKYEEGAWGSAWRAGTR